MDTLPTSKNIARNCPVCNKEYFANPSRLKRNRDIACSRECSYKYRMAKRPKAETETRECSNCGISVTREKWAFQHDETFCSLECYHTHRANLAGYETPLAVSGDCEICGTPFKRHKRSNKYCSRKCFELAHKLTMRGENNPSYIDGRSLDATYDVGAEWDSIRKQVYERDNYTCQICDVKCVSKKVAMKDSSKTHLIIQCHHIVPYRESQNNDLKNLVTLCLICHRAVHDGKYQLDFTSTEGEAL